jgi:uncharacterized protein
VIHLSRIHCLERGDKVLVMDRLNGRWLMLSAAYRPILPLLGTDRNKIYHAKLKDQVEQLENLLVSRGIGHAEPHRSNGLNTVILKLTKACNLACSYCYDFEPEDRARHMEYNMALAAICQAIDICKGKINFILHGGEPMLVWPMIETLVLEGQAYGREKGIEICFTGQTNLTRLNAHIVSFSLLHGIHWGISFDGPRELHDRFRVKHNGKEGSYDTILTAVTDYPHFVKRCNALSTITSSNQQYLIDIALHVRELGFAGWDWSLFQAIGRGRNSVPFDCDSELLIAAWDKLFDAVERGVFTGFPVKPILKYLDNFMDGPVDNMCMRSQCGAGRDLLSVSYDGTIEACDCIDPCSPLAHIGHMRSGGLLQARNSSKAETIRSRDVETLQCGSCIWQAVCGGSCMARAGGVDKISEQECLLSLHAFDRISNSIAATDALIQYKQSCET